MASLSQRKTDFRVSIRLKNFGNTCYTNSALQSFLSRALFLELLEAGGEIEALYPCKGYSMLLAAAIKKPDGVCSKSITLLNRLSMSLVCLHC